jgi:hypothetical protein
VLKRLRQSKGPFRMRNDSKYIKCSGELQLRPSIKKAIVNITYSEWNRDQALVSNYCSKFLLLIFHTRAVGLVGSGFPHPIMFHKQKDCRSLTSLRAFMCRSCCAFEI